MLQTAILSFNYTTLLERYHREQITMTTPCQIHMQEVKINLHTPTLQTRRENKIKH